MYVYCVDRFYAITAYLCSELKACEAEGLPYRPIEHRACKGPPNIFFVVLIFWCSLGGEPFL